MMTLANYGIKSNKYKDPISAKSLNKSLQIRNRAESTLRHCLKTYHRASKDKRNDIIESLEEYYSRVPFDVLVWNTEEAKQCVVESILSLNTQFNPYKARQAFRTIEQMLLNIEYLPWHKEFTRIFTYSGGFKHNVNDPLVGAEDLLKAAGFEQESNECSMHLVFRPAGNSQNETLERLTGVVFDCMLAQVVISDIIEIFENCCKASKVGPHLIQNDEINCYSWIQHYFRERSHQINEKASSSVRELLNNVTNHLMKIKMTSVKTSTKNDRPLDELALEKVTNETALPRRETGDTQQRKFVASKATEDSKLFGLADDLLKLPNYSEHDSRGQAAEFDSYPPPYSEYLTNGSSSRLHEEEAHGCPQRAVSQYHNNEPKLLSRPRDLLDTMDNQEPRINNARLERNGFEPTIVRPESFHNDRELLISKHDRKFVQNQKDLYRQDRCQPTSSRQVYRSQSNVAPNLEHYKIHPTSGASRSGYDDARFKTCHPSQPTQIASKSSSSRYECDTDHGKYDYQDPDRPFSSRSYWSCDTCTFYNHTSNKVCEMCANRRPS